jgi:hypothetical protein
VRAVIASPSPVKIYFIICLRFKHFEVIHVLTAQSVAQRKTIMTTFTIDAENNITSHSSKKAARETGAGVFSNEVQFADLIGPDHKRLLEIWNSLPGVKPVTKFANRKMATERIWKVIQGLGEARTATPAVEPEAGGIAAETAPVEVPAAAPATEPAVTDASPTVETVPVEVSGPVGENAEAAEPVADAGAPAADVAPAETPATKKATRATKAPKAKKAPKTESAGPREGSKTAQVVAMLQRKNGATLGEIMTTMGWQKHTVRGFMAGAMKKAGYTVESFKPEGGERSYRINA